MSDNAIARAVASKVRVAYELETDFAKLVDAAKAGALPEDVAREVLALADRKVRRRVHLVDKCGRVVRDTTDVEIAIGALRRKEIEFGVVEGVTQQTVCAGVSGMRCPDHAKPARKAFFPSTIKARGGAPWVCRACHMRKMRARVDLERRAASVRKALATRTPEQRVEFARQANATRTAEERSAISRANYAAMTLAQREQLVSKALDGQARARRARAANKETADVER